MFSEIITRHQVMVERLKTQQVRDWVVILQEALTFTRGRLAEVTDLSSMSVSNRRRFMQKLEADLKDRMKAWEKTVLDQLAVIAAAEHAFEAKAFQQVIDTAKTLTKQALFRGIQERPLSMQGGAVLKDLTKDFRARVPAMLTNFVIREAAQGSSNAALTRSLKPVADQLLRQHEAVTRSAIRHTSSAAREAVWLQNAEALGANKYRWRAILDSKTCQQCQGLDMRTFKVGQGPLPPVHHGCRCFAEPIVDDGVKLSDGTRASSKGQVPGDQNYFDWLKKQPTAFQNMAIGPKRAKLLRDGGLTSKRFQQLMLDRNFEPMTLAEMQKLEPLAFEKISN